MRKVVIQMAGIKMRRVDREMFENPVLAQNLSYDRSKDAILAWYQAKYEAFKAAQAAKKASK